MANIYNEENRWWAEESDSDFVKLFDPKDIAVDVKHFAIGTLLRKIELKEIDLFPAFQRQFDLWSDELKSQLIESILLNFPIPPLYLDASNYEKWIVVDGLQRLWSLKHFIIDQQFKLKGLSALAKLNGYRFGELERQHQRKIEEYTLLVYLIMPGVPRFAVYDIFRRLNTGGVSLNPQEIRHALNPRGSEFLDGLLKSNSFKKLVKPRSKRMENFELVLRFCAFYMHGFEKYQPPMLSFLDRTMEELNNAEDGILYDLGRSFFRAHDFIYENFQDQLFQKKTPYSQSKRFNKGLYEIWTVLVAKLDGDQLEELSRKRDSIIIDFLYLSDEIIFNESISATTASRRAVTTRFGMLQNLLSNRTS